MRYVIDQRLSEMLGLAKGIVCDGCVNAAETVAFKQWFAANPDAAIHYPGNVIAERVMAMLADGIVDDDEQVELRDLLLSLVGEPKDLTGSMNEPSRLPLDDPPPTLFFDRKEYVFTGRFAFGTRAKCMKAVADRAGRCSDYITAKTDVLVVGMIASPDWIQSTHGRKIESAMEINRQGHRRIAIVSEEHWIEALQFDA